MKWVARVGFMCFAAMAMAALGLALPAGGADTQPEFGQIVEHLTSVNPSLRTVTVEQTAIVHWMGIFHFLLRTTVYATRPALYKVIVHEAPAIVRPLGDTFYLISSPEQVLADYRASSIRQRADGSLVIELTAARPNVNPPSGIVVIDAKRWLVQEIVLNYQWGKLTAQYRYAEIEGFLLPDAVAVSLARFPLSAELTYTDYKLNAPIDPSVFAQDPLR